MGEAVTAEHGDMNFDFTVFMNYIQSPIRWFEALDPVSRNTVVSALALFVSTLALYAAYRGFKLARAKDEREKLTMKLGAATKEEAENRDTLPERLAVLAMHPALDIRKLVALNPSTPSPTLVMLAKDSAQAVRLAVAGNVGTPRQALTSLAKYPNVAVRLSKKLANVARLFGLRAKDPSKDYSTRVRVAVAGNSNTLPKTLDRLAKHSDVAVCRAVVGNSNTLPETLDRLAKHADVAVCRAVAGNSSTLPETLDRLAKHADVAVCRAVAGNEMTRPILIAELIRHRDATVGAAAGGNRMAPPSELVMYRTIRQREVRAAIQANIALPAAISAMASHPDPATRRHVAELDETPAAVLKTLAEDRDSAVNEAATRALAAKPPNTWQAPIGAHRPRHI
jgi:hypothetical protein